MAKVSVGTHECPVHGCSTRVPYDRLMCVPHWRRVPKVLAAAVWDAARNDWLGDGHLAAQAAAINAVNDKIANEAGV